VTGGTATENRSAEEPKDASSAHRRKTEEFDSLLRALPDIYFRLDATGRIVAWHAGRESELHVPPEAFLGRRPEEVVPPDVGPIIAAAVERVRASRELTIAEYTLATPSGDDQFEARLVPCGDDEVTALIRNTTAWRRAEAALRASEERLRVSQKLEAIGRLAGGVAHDFNNLLTVVLGRLQLLQRTTSLEGEERVHVDEALDAASHAVSLTRQLLTLSRRGAPRTVVFALSDVIEPMHDVLRRMGGENLELVLSLDEAAGLVRADPAQIEQVVLNLVLNARDAMPSGGTVIVACREVVLDEAQAALRDGGARPGPHVVLSVSDTGSGMSTDVIDHLFEPFFTTKEPGAGTGLGLATVYGIVQQSGGHTQVRSEVGVGSTFELWFPRADVPRSPLPEDEGPAAGQPVAGGGETVLLVEDEDGVRRLALEILQRAGYRVLAAAGGDEALRLLLEERRGVDLLLTDVVMPRVNGRIVAARVTQLRPETRVLLMSGYDAERAGPRKSSDGEAGGEDYPLLDKPFTERALLARVREVLDAPREEGVQ
jgi:signal transduction histidine kinase